MLYDRILKTIDIFGLTKSKIAEEIGVTYKTFSGYLKPEGEHNLWQYLPLLLELCPRLSRQWLYFGEGPMRIGFGVPLDRPVPLQEIAEAVEAMANDAGGTNEMLLRYIAGLPKEWVDEGRTENKQIVKTLEKKLAETQAELLQASKKIIQLQDELIAMSKNKPDEVTFNHRTGNTTARTLHGAAPLEQEGNK